MAGSEWEEEEEEEEEEKEEKWKEGKEGKKESLRESCFLLLKVVVVEGEVEEKEEWGELEARATGAVAAVVV